DLMGSLAWTGAGHATDKAVVLGLAGCLPDTIKPDLIDAIVQQAITTKRLQIAGHDIAFDPARDIVFDRESHTPIHPNTLRFVAPGDDGGELVSERWCSIGGGFIAREEQVGAPASENAAEAPFPFRTASELLTICARNGLSIAEVVSANELAGTT